MISAAAGGAMPAEEGGEREARSVALERTYVHDVYCQMAQQLTDLRHRPWPRVRQFLADLEPGSLVCDVGCGDGKYLSLNADAYFVGGDRCKGLLVTAARQTRQQVVVCDALSLPFRDESVDAAVSVAVIHHLATTERRVRALRELARVLRIGGRLIVTVWAMEQRARKFESQDVLVPWSAEPVGASASEERTSLAEPEVISTTSDDEPLNYSAFTHTSDSDSSRSPRSRLHVRRAGRRSHRIPSIDPTMLSSSQSSSGLSSPSESCYSFVRRALQKLARRGEVDGSRPWIFSPWPSYSETKPTKAGDGATDGQLIEIRLDDDVSGLEEAPRRRNTFGCEQSSSTGGGPQLTAFKSRSVGDMWSLLSASILGRKADSEGDRPRSFMFEDPGEQVTVKKGGGKTVTFSTQSLTLPREKLTVDVIGKKSKSDSVLDSRVRACEPMKASLTTVPENDVRDGVEGAEAGEETAEPGAETTQATSKPSLVRQRRLGDEPAVPRVCSEELPPTARPVRGILKQTSLNENLMRRDWAGERQQIRSKIIKQQSLNENVIYGKQASAQEAPKAGIFANYSRLKALRDSLGKLGESLEKLTESEPQPCSLKNGLVRMVRQLTDSSAMRTDAAEPEQSSAAEAVPERPSPAPAAAPQPSVGARCPGPRSCSLPERAQPEPVTKGCLMSGPGCNRPDRRGLYRYCPRERKTSREESSDSSKENSFQSDTSLDSEDSCVSVIFVPKVEATETEAKERSRSASSESSDGSNGKLSPKSPLTSVQPVSPTRLTAVPGRGGGFKGPPNLGAQILQSNLHGRFHLMEPPAGAAGSAGSASSVTAPSSSDATKTFTKAPPSRATSLPSSDRISGGTVLTSSAAPTPPEPSTHNAPPSHASSSTSKHPAMSGEPPVAPRSLPDVVMSSGAGALQRPPSGPAVRDRVSALMAGSVQPPSPSPMQPRADSSSFKFLSETSSSDSGSGAVGGSSGGGASTPYSSGSSGSSGGTTGSTSGTSGTTTGGLRPSGVSSQVSSLIMGENIEIIRRAGVQGFRNVQGVRRVAPHYLTFEVFNPETDDLDSESSCASSTSSSSASSPSSACSVISLASDWPSAQEIQELDRQIEQQERERTVHRSSAEPSTSGGLSETGGTSIPGSHLSAPCETDDSLSSSPEPPVRLSSPRGRRKVTLARLDAPPLEQVLEEAEPEAARVGASARRRATESDGAATSLASSVSSTSSLSTSDGYRSAGPLESALKLAQTQCESGTAAASPPITAKQIFDRAEAAAAAAAAAGENPEGEEVPVSRQGSSEDSLPSDRGGELGHHRYYHVFREKELDRLIEKYVDNLHIISSYYDHANWCVVAEKVQVWTI
ncbi:mucin-5AC-like [Amphibalanus amphitrite]|uniref:mucin-5AC-like n=1 Tax=Amphibalanus amphitrite TaxID=1232801 RepID=UPI001C9160C7|nr:mucin-5AC-like [Amphibalanus amphitrite]